MRQSLLTKLIIFFYNSGFYDSFSWRLLGAETYLYCRLRFCKKRPKGQILFKRSEADMAICNIKCSAIRE